MSSLPYIRGAYGVPAKRGGRVSYTGDGPARLGTILGATRACAYLRVRPDDGGRVLRLHPTWKIEYLPPDTTKAADHD